MPSLSSTLPSPLGTAARAPSPPPPPRGARPVSPSPSPPPHLPPPVSVTQLGARPGAPMARDLELSRRARPLPWLARPPSTWRGVPPGLPRPSSSRPWRAHAHPGKPPPTCAARPRPGFPRPQRGPVWCAASAPGAVRPRRAAVAPARRGLAPPCFLPPPRAHLEARRARGHGVVARRGPLRARSHLLGVATVRDRGSRGAAHGQARGLAHGPLPLSQRGVAPLRNVAPARRDFGSHGRGAPT
jgi:hypothetical protein